MGKIFLLFIVNFLFIFYPAHLSYSQNQGLSRVRTSQYLHTAEFNTVSGVLKVNLPADMSVSEQVSGSVFFDRYKLGEVSSASLNDYSLIVENQKVNISGNMFTVIVPTNLPTGVLNVLVKDSTGKDVGRAFYPVRIRASANHTKRENPSDFRMPLSARTGLPTEIQGPFDGNYSNSVLSIDGKKISVVAESPRKLVFISPQTAKGARLLALSETGVEVKSPFTNLHVIRVGRDDLLEYESSSSEVVRNYETSEFLIERDNASRKILSDEKELLISSRNQNFKEDKPALNQYKPIAKKVAVKEGDQLKEYKINDLSSLNLENKKFEQQITLEPTKKEALEKVEVAKIQAEPKARAKKTKNSKTFAIQLASFKERSEAEKLVNKLNSKGHNAYFEKFNVPGKRYWNRVRIGGFETRNEAENYKGALNFKDLYIKSFFVTFED